MNRYWHHQFESFTHTHTHTHTHRGALIDCVARGMSFRAIVCSPRKPMLTGGNIYIYIYICIYKEKEKENRRKDKKIAPVNIIVVLWWRSDGAGDSVDSGWAFRSDRNQSSSKNLDWAGGNDTAPIASRQPAVPVYTTATYNHIKPKYINKTYSSENLCDEVTKKKRNGKSSRNQFRRNFQWDYFGWKEEINRKRGEKASTTGAGETDRGH